MGIAKSVEIQVTTVPTTQTTTPIEHSHLDGVPIDLYRFFSVDLADKDQGISDKLKEIYQWSKQGLDEPTIGNSMAKLRNIEQKLGSPDISEKRYDRLHNYMKISKQIEDLEKRREALHGRTW